MDDAEVEWRAHTTQICHIEADTEKHRQEVLVTTNAIEDAIQKNNALGARGPGNQQKHLEYIAGSG